MFELTDRVVVVTGAGSGIGRAIALLFAQKGARVAAFDRDLAAAQATVSAITAASGVGHATPVDVSQSDAVNRAFDEVALRWGGVDVLVNSAGIAHVGTLQNTPEADFDQLYQVNVKGVFLCARAALPHLLKARGGSILNLASIASLIALKDRFAYSMTKGAVLTMTRSIALDYMGLVRCNCLCPARVHTPFVDQFVAKNYPGREQEMLAQLAAYQPIGRMGTPEEVAAFALYLCSDEASFVTGGAFPIDGGVLVA